MGFAHGHPAGIFWVLNPKTREINLSHDVNSLNNLFGEWNKVNNLIIVLIIMRGQMTRAMVESFSKIIIILTTPIM